VEVNRFESARCAGGYGPGRDIGPGRIYFSALTL